MGTFDQFINAIPEVTMSRDSMPSQASVEICTRFPFDYRNYRSHRKVDRCPAGG
jgi:hypothetical protein